MPRSSDSSGHRVLRGVCMLAAFGVLGGLAPGCYLSHGRGEDPEVVPVDRGPGGRGSGPDAGVPDDAMVTGPDAFTPSSDAGLPLDFDVCEAVCEAQDAAGCTIMGCYEGCDARRERAAEIDCGAEFKGTLSCLISDPCNRDVETNCGAMNGWPECLMRARP